MPHRYVIIGTGGAGLAAAEAIRYGDPDGSIAIFGDDPHGFYSRPGIAYYLTGEMSKKQLSLRQGECFKISLAPVTVVRPEAHVIVADGKEHTYDRLLLATGSVAVGLSIPGADLKGVIKLV